MRCYAIDTGALELYFAGHTEMKRIYNEIKNKTAKGFTLETNLTELFYVTCRKLGKQVALIRDNSIRTSEIELRTINKQISRSAGRLKCKIPDISLADALLAGAAILSNATVITTDENFEKIEEIDILLLSI